QARHAVVLARARRQHDDRHVSPVGTRSKNPTHLDAAQDRKIQVENDQIWWTVCDDLQSGVAALDDFCLSLAASLQRVFDETGDILLVLDNQNAVPCHVPPDYMSSGPMPGSVARWSHVPRAAPS